MTNSIKNLKNNIILQIATVMEQTSDTFTITIISPDLLTIKNLRALRTLNGQTSKTGIRLVVKG